MAAKETVTESVISVFQTVLEFVLFHGCFGKLIKLNLRLLLWSKKETSGLIEISMSRK